MYIVSIINFQLDFQFQLHFCEDDIYLDAKGKLRRIPKSVPVFKTVPQVGATIPRTKISDDFDPDLENTSLSDGTSDDPEQDVEYRDYEFLDEAFAHPEGLGFGIDESQRETSLTDANDSQTNCSSCKTATQTQKDDKR